MTHSASLDRRLSTARAPALASPLSPGRCHRLPISVDGCASIASDPEIEGSLGHILSCYVLEKTGETGQKRLRLGYQINEPHLRLLPGSGALEPRAERPARRPSTRIVGPLPEKGKAYVNVLPMATRVRVISALVEGNSIRATGRMVEVGKAAVGRLALMVGKGCARLHDRMVRNMAAYVVQMDEVWSFIHTKEARVTPKDPAEYGDAYTYVALDANLKLVLSYHVGKRDGENTETFVKDLRARLTVVPHVTSDGWQPYIDAVWKNFKGSVDYGMCVKNYRTGSTRGPDHRYEPPRNPFITKTPIAGVPRDELLSTSFVERFNLTSRHMVGRTRRLCLAFSKKLSNHAAAIALGIFAYNFTRIHSTLGCTPAQAAGLTDHAWTIEELVTAALAEPEGEAPVAQPLKLVPRPGEAQGPARELSGGRGFLRLVPGGKSAGVALPPEAPTSAPIDAVAIAGPPDADGQLTIWDYKPRPAQPLPTPGTQLSLFGDPPDAK